MTVHVADERGAECDAGRAPGRPVDDQRGRRSAVRARELALARLAPKGVSPASVRDPATTLNEGTCLSSCKAALAGTPAGAFAAAIR
jgi:hypothetical protein